MALRRVRDSDALAPLTCQISVSRLFGTGILWPLHRDMTTKHDLTAVSYLPADAVVLECHLFTMRKAANLTREGPGRPHQGVVAETVK